MDTLPEFLISETFDYIDARQLGNLRTVSRSWRKALSPAAGKHISCKAVANKTDVESLSRFLEAHGRHTQSIALEKVTPEKVHLLSKYCKGACSLTVAFSNAKQTQAEVFLVLTLAKGLKRLKMAKFCAGFERNILKSLDPVIKKVSTLILSFMPSQSTEPSGEALQGMLSSSVKYLTLLNVTIDGERFVELIHGFKQLVLFHSVPDSSQAHGFSFSYDVKKAKFREICITDNSEMIFADIVFSSAPENGGTQPPLKKSQRSKKDPHLPNFNTLERLDAYGLISKYTRKLPPIEAIRLEINNDAEGGELDNINEAILEFRNVENLAVEIKYCSEGKVAMDCIDFKAKSMYFSSTHDFYTNHILWLIHHFPLLQDLYLPHGSISDLAQAARDGLTFASLQRVFAYEEYTMSFWEKLVKMAPRLYQINIKPNSPRRAELVTKFPSILIGIYSGPKHFLGPLSTYIPNVYNGRRRGHASNYPDPAYLGNTEPESSMYHSEESNSYSSEASLSEESYFM
ncbi:hypothetical protein DSO57_1039116 [Entomophthora muscae]|uniref:Uncharacterized protein n=1 Tax=Entomophthora muscae TaxID=34485 RepID=A0ACC2U7U9_9FUNG|nr:hypothetical protein DSO57_1039116 [Entomophthora muscae]